MLDKDIKQRIPKEVILLIKEIKRHNHQAFMVGGSVRDIILGREILDWDIATSASPALIMRLFRKSYPTGIRHGTVTVIYKGVRFEVTAFRSESDYSDGRHPDRIKFGVSIEEDLSRRDFTINAIAYDPLEERIIDPYGGIGDIEKGLIKCVGSAYDRFSEDGLRSLRAVRFASILEYRLHRDIVPAIRDTIQIFLKVSAERVREEILKMMKSRRPSAGIILMQKSGLLECVFPELVNTIGFRQNRWHKYDLFKHSLRTMDFLPPDDPELRLIGLLHDIAKPICKSGQTENATYYGHDIKGAEMVGEIFLRLKFPKRSVARAKRIVANHMKGYTSDWTDAAVRRLMKKLGQEIYTLIDFQKADVMARGTEVRSTMALLNELERRVRKLESEETALNLNQLKVNGNDVMRIRKIPPSPEVGRILKRLMEMVIERPEINRRDTLLNLIKTL
ncbi:MAG: CCA tRNA nucleotidyltransferase [Deltaproteobacteria bacterium]|nr:CCA tRNA nucleotidyltransferase [Deltaproteobacteria bacterium]